MESDANQLAETARRGDRAAAVRLIELFDRAIDCGSAVGQGDNLIRPGFRCRAGSPPFVGTRLGVMVGAPPIHIDVVGDAVHPRGNRSAPGKRRQCLPNAAKGPLGEIGGIRVIGGEPPQEGVNALVEKLD